MHRTKLLLAAVLMIAFTCGMSFGAEYFIAPGGNDEAEGTREAPWQSLEKASEAAQAGDTVTLLPGSYPGQLQPVNSGTAEDPIVFRAEPRRSATLTGPPSGFAILLEDVQHVRLEGLQVDPDGSYTSWLRIRNASHIEVEDCRMERSTGGLAALIDGAEDIVVRTSVFQEQRGGINMFRISSTTRLLFEGNVISRAAHSPLQFYPPNTNRYLVVRGNVFHSAWGRSFEFFHDTDVLFEHNIVTHAFNGGWSNTAMTNMGLTRAILRHNRIFRNVGGPISMHPWAREDGYLADTRVYNNVFDDNANQGITVQSASEYTRDLVIANNIFSRNDPHGVQRAVEMRAGTAEQVRVIGNAITGVEPGQAIVHDYGEVFTVEAVQDAELQAEHGARYVANLDADPGYVDPEQYNHALRADSPLRNAGSFLTTASGDGVGMLLAVEDAAYFYDGFGIEGEQGDLIAVGRSEQRARVLAVDHEANSLLLDREISWQDGDPVSLPWSGDAPDIGVYEHGDDGRVSVQVVVEPFRAHPGQPVTLRAVVHGDAQPQQIRWWLGDGNSAEGAEVTHTYAEDYDYAVRVQVLDTEGRTHYGPGYVWVEAPRDPSAPLIHSTWGPEDDSSWWLWKSYRVMPTAYRDVVEGGVRHGANTRSIPEGYEPPGDGVNYRHVMAPEDGSTLTAVIHPDGWDIDRYPEVFVRYRMGEGTPLMLALKCFGTNAWGWGRSTAVVALSPAGESGLPAITDHVLHDDGEWHELTFDVRKIRDLFPDVQVLEGMHFFGMPRGAVKEGHWYDLDEVIIRPATVD